MDWWKDRCVVEWIGGFFGSVPGLNDACMGGLVSVLVDGWMDK